MKTISRLGICMLGLVMVYPITLFAETHACMDAVMNMEAAIQSRDCPRLEASLTEEFIRENKSVGDGSAPDPSDRSHFLKAHEILFEKALAEDYDYDISGNPIIEALSDTSWRVSGVTLHYSHTLGKNERKVEVDVTREFTAWIELQDGHYRVSRIVEIYEG